MTQVVGAFDRTMEGGYCCARDGGEYCQCVVPGAMHGSSAGGVETRASGVQPVIVECVERVSVRLRYENVEAVEGGAG